MCQTDGSFQEHREQPGGPSSPYGGEHGSVGAAHPALGSPRPVGSAPGGRTSAPAASPTPRWHRAAPGGRARLGARSCRLCRWGRAARRGGLCPARGELQRPSALARRRRLSRLSPLSPASCQRGAGPGSPERGCRRWGRGAAGCSAEASSPSQSLRGSGVPAASPPRPVPSGGAAHEVKMVIRVFVASSSGSVAIKKRQQDVVRFLEANRIEFEEVDITMSEEKRQWMYKNIPEDRQPAQGNPLPPQIFSDDRYCGDYDGFFESKESNTVFSFLGLKPTLTSKESEP
ncbi:SH3 domain-binding glutamic acid-rich-like protein 2 [Lathamus discolor]|uniref:SH3 domain-binding glutamic acid-rich-like protein 2 n=1 Tax=Lathamus discolor TaxID=678569 RepID=UPI0032B807AF